MSVNQINDDGAVIGYKPDLRYIKERNTSTQTDDTASTDQTGSVSYSDTLSGFKNNTPSKALSNIDFVTDNLKKLVDKLSQAFDKGNWNQYGDISTLLSAVENNNSDYINDFVEYHFSNINGSIVPELIKDLYDTKTRMETLEKVIKQLYYGDESISTEQAEEIDSAYISKMESYESTGENAKINYMTLAYDSILNKSISMNAFNTNKQAINIANIVNLTDDTDVNSAQASLVKKLYSDVNDKLSYRINRYDQEQSVETMKKTLYNYYYKRKDLQDLYDLIDSSDSTFLKRKVADFQTDVTDSIKDINRSFAGNQVYLAEKCNLEREKNYILNIYAQLNYNS